MRTLNEIEHCGKDILAPADVAWYLQCDAYNITLQAREDPSKLGFPVIVMGTRTKIPREGFVRYCRAMGLEDPA